MTTNTCTDPAKCGHPQIGPGHPRKGWINVKTAGVAGSTWWCSPTCLARSLTGTTARSDVATCPACINRHDRAHRCPACNTTPHIVSTVVAPTRLYQRAHDSISAGPEARP